jgi:hypothetical protein
MNFTLTRDNPQNTVMMAPDGNSMYQIETPTKFFGSSRTHIKTRSGDIGMIEWNSWGSDVLIVWGWRVVPAGKTFGRYVNCLFHDTTYLRKAICVKFTSLSSLGREKL